MLYYNRLLFYLYFRFTALLYRKRSRISPRGGKAKFRHVNDSDENLRQNILRKPTF